MCVVCNLLSILYKMNGRRLVVVFVEDDFGME